ncbi:hypothetical protein B0T22DRAFT_539483 [Podospora appendiculata]|uniref:TRP C-terminal domain-containing protein n=1 Tax=Podospora appendiculata TaxID=314037 RepID=A0AAE0X0N7_9PEZI|nr:hypothetical protein B0T22DRAFT_539483 [Podospora appendiculata]
MSPRCRLSIGLTLIQVFAGLLLLLHVHAFDGRFSNKTYSASLYELAAVRDTYPDGLPGLPYCGQYTASCPTAYNSCCTAAKCSLTFFGACMQTATLIDMACALGNGSCVDARYGCLSSYYYGGDMTAETLESLVEPYLNLPSCMARDCYAYYQTWNDSVLDWYSSAWLNTSTYPWLIDQYSERSIHLERTDVCGSAYKNACSGTCAGSKSETAELLLWLNNTCTGSASFERLLPQNWTETVAANCVKDDTSVKGPDSVVDFPSCIDPACGDGIRLSANKSSEFYCVLDPQTGRYATGSLSVVHFPDFCRTLSYPSTCNSSCTLAFDRRDWLTYLNSTCAATAGAAWTGLPSNWTDLLSIQVSDLRPRQSVVRSTSYWDTILCPSPESSLGVFAAVNVAMLLLTPILGRRTVVSKLTVGLLGKPHSQGWMFMGPVMAALQSAANAGNIALIKATPGYEDTDWKTLMMLWYTRPRLAWLVVFLIQFQVDEAMYFSCAATTLTTEIILQILGSYVMGTVASHARVQKFYTNALAVAAVPRGKDAMLMYVGAIFWLVVVFFTLLAVGTSVLNVSTQIFQIGRLINLDAFRRVEINLEEFERTSGYLSQNGYRQAAGVYEEMMEHMSSQMTGILSAEKSLEQLTQLAKGPERQYRLALARLNGDPKAAGDVDAAAGIVRDMAQKQLLALEPTLAQAAARRSIAEAAYRDAVMRRRALKNRTQQPGGTPTDREDLRIMKNGWKVVIDRWADAEGLLINIKAKWQARTALLSSREWSESIRRKLKRIVIQTSLGMFASWGSQWLFWVGFVRLYVPDAYCPPKLTYLALTWISVSILGRIGAPLGASV